MDLCGTVLDSLCAHLQQLLVYEDGEKDAVYLNHFIGIRWPDNKVGVVGCDGIYECSS